jgi:hypothetical protein
MGREGITERKNGISWIRKRTREWEKKWEGEKWERKRERQLQVGIWAPIFSGKFTPVSVAICGVGLCVRRCYILESVTIFIYLGSKVNTRI